MKESPMDSCNTLNEAIDVLHHIGVERRLHDYLKRIVPELQQTSDAAKYVRYGHVTNALFKRFPLVEEPEGISPCGCDFLAAAFWRLGLITKNEWMGQGGDFQ